MMNPRTRCPHRLRRPAVGLVLILALGATAAQAQIQGAGYYNAYAGPVYLNEEGLAISGYDPVAYQTVGRAVKGAKEFTLTYDGATYLFASRENLNLFAAEPERYVPAFGGWCAYGLATRPGTPNTRKPGKYRASPRTFKVIDGKLYLFYNRGGFNALQHWNKDEAAYLIQAHAAWDAIGSLGASD